MGTPRIYQQEQLLVGQRVTLSKEAAHHVAVVLRMHPGEALRLFCGDNREFYATIVSTHKKEVVVDVTAVREANRESSRAIHLAQGLSKGERFEWAIQKAVELGVYSITPVITSRCVIRLSEDRLAKKQAQWRAIAIAACEQCGRNAIPEIRPAVSLGEYLAQDLCDNRFVLHPLAEKLSRQLDLKEGPISLLIGPEGGFCEEEVTQTSAAQFEALKFGPRLLRTETATVVALGVLQSIGGDL